MSSRALRKLKGDGRNELEQLAEEDDELNFNLAAKPKKKKNKPSTINPFDLLENEDENQLNDSLEKEEVEDQELENGEEQTTKPKKKKKKKKKGKPEGKEEEDELEAAIKEVKEKYGETDQQYAHTTAEDTMMCSMYNLLKIEHRNLNPENEMRKIFGARAVQGDTNRRQGRNRNVRQRPTKLTTRKDTWPHMIKTGLSMRLDEAKPGGVQFFVFEHSREYQKTQWLFLDAVESMQPEAIMNVLHVSPYHVDSLLQLSEVCKMSEDAQMAAELIERGLYAFECCFHPSFSLTQGTCRLDYKRPENRAFFLALFRHIVFVGNRGCYRTSLEFCKLLLSLEPDSDPLCMLLMLDFYALRSQEYDFLIRMGQEWESHRNLSQLPNFAFSVPLAMFHVANKKGESTEAADTKLQDALIMFPGLLIPLLDRCNVEPDPKVATHAFFGHNAQTHQPPALKQLVSLYVGRCCLVWKEPDVLTWLEKNCHRVMERVDAGDKQVTVAKQKRKTRYQGTPRSIYRHIIISEIKEAIGTLPPEITGTSILSYDPLPPQDSITTYERPHRPRRAEMDGNALSMFVRSLLPNYNPQEIVDPQEALGAAAGAEGGGGADLQAGVGALMNAMRDLLANIQPAPAPREDGEEDENAGVPNEEWD